MPKADNHVASRARRKKILKMARGYRLSKSKLLKTAKESVENALLYAYRDRRQKRRNFRQLWITRINAACRPHGISYSRLIHGLSEKNILINRKMLAELAMNEPDAFAAVVKKVNK